MLEEIFKSFYNLKNNKRQKEFIHRHVVEKETRTYLGSDKQPTSKTRYVWRHYNLTIGGSLLPVCKSFFIQILDTGHGYIQHAVENCKDGIFTGEERRKRTPSDKIPEKITIKEAHRILPGGQKSLLRNRGRQKTPRLQFVHQLKTPVCPSTKDSSLSIN